MEGEAIKGRGDRNAFSAAKGHRVKGLFLRVSSNADTAKCGIKQLITRSEFMRIDTVCRHS